MLNFDTKREAIQRLESAVGRYNDLAPDVIDGAQRLYELRRTTSRELIVAVERYVNTLANSPKEFEKSVSKFRVAIDRFDAVVETVQAESLGAVVRSGVGAGASVGLGAATMAAAPAAAMGIATTFGTASTGTAIAALSGAAQVNAALAWLGGGALAAGGGGMAAGAKVLAVLGGPVGWGIGALALAGTAAWTNHKNNEIAEKANAEAGSVEAKIQALRAAQAEIGRLENLTKEHAGGVRDQLRWLVRTAPRDYRQFADDAKEHLGGLINNIQALAKLLNTQVA